MENITVFTPASMKSLLTALQEMKTGCEIIAGGTDKGIALRNRKTKPAGLLVLGNVPEMNSIVSSNGITTIGACVTFSQLCQFSFGIHLEMIKDAAGQVGSQQIRNIGTIGGNIINASPASDMLPVLVLLGTEAEILTDNGFVYRKKLADLVTGAGKTSLKYNEIVTKLLFCTPVSDCFFSVYQKLGYRPRLSIARIGLALSIVLEEDHRHITDAKVYLGAIAEKPVALPDGVSFLLGKDLHSFPIEEFCSILSETVKATTRTAYKIDAIKGVGYDAIEKLQERNARIRKLR